MIDQSSDLVAADIFGRGKSENGQSTAYGRKYGGSEDARQEHPGILAPQQAEGFALFQIRGEESVDDASKGLVCRKRERQAHRDERHAFEDGERHETGPREAPA